MGSGATEPPKDSATPECDGREQRKTHNTLKFFKYDHLPEKLQDISRPFCEMAFFIQEELPFNAESATAMRKLLEAKDAAVRSIID